MGPRKCEVCRDADSKYKCPSCLLPYCSIPCFKKHKEIPCTKPPSPQSNPAPISHNGTSYQIDEDNCVLKRSQLESIAASNEIRDALRNDELRKSILKIDSSKDAFEELDKAMEGQNFKEFADKILCLLSPQEQ
ncbi:hypothetical protein QJS04_geneDACA000131 [Acorus gramineus]|uniref:Zinc finger HIT domain-containing protein 3 n=1 Tax=Acorus gramineus TaxID=55184 RepID=A0AAV9ATI2_ACOGR|nr:hypothetical protein QJS04_geneDACA000131 [Acorus gramineus]